MVGPEAPRFIADAKRMHRTALGALDPVAAPRFSAKNRWAGPLPDGSCCLRCAGAAHAVMVIVPGVFSVNPAGISGPLVPLARGMVARKPRFNAVLDELAHCFGWSGIAEKAARAEAGKRSG